MPAVTSSRLVLGLLHTCGILHVTRVKRPAAASVLKGMMRLLRNVDIVVVRSVLAV